MTLESRIAAVMADWADAGDDLPEEMKIIRELQLREASLRKALKYLFDETALVIFSNGQHDVSDFGGYAAARTALAAKEEAA